MQRRSGMVCVILFALLAATPIAHAADSLLPLRTHYHGGQLRSELVPSPDGKDVIFRYFSPKGQLQFETWMQGGDLKTEDEGGSCSGNKKNGVFRCENKASQTISYHPYRGYLLHGQARSITQHGRDTITYRDGEKHGIQESVRRYEQTSMRETSHYVHGKLNGTSSRYQNGKLTELYTWKDDEVNGRCMELSDWRERVGHCRGTMGSIFTGVERRYTVDSIPRKRKSKSGDTMYRSVRRLEAIIHYKDGKVVSEKTIKRKGRSPDYAHGSADGGKAERARQRAKARLDALYNAMNPTIIAMIPTADLTIRKHVTKATAAKLKDDNAIDYYHVFPTGLTNSKQLGALGLQRDDILVAINQQLLDQWNWEVLACLAKTSPCTYRVFRRGKIVDLQVHIDQ